MIVLASATIAIIRGGISARTILMVIEAVRLFLNTVVFAMPSAPTEDHNHKNDDMVNPTIFSNTEALIFGCDSPTMTCKGTFIHQHLCDEEGRPMPCYTRNVGRK